MRQIAPLLLVLISVAATIFAYLQALNFPLVIDDQIYLNSKLSGLPPSELWRLLIEPYNIFDFLPLRDLSYWLELTLNGLNPPLFRIDNIILYLSCLPLVYATTVCLWRYYRPTDEDASWAAATVTALFALHPAHVEAVVWISGRKDILSTLFSLLALWLAVNAKREQGLSPAYAAGALLALLAAMLSKATAIAVAPVITLLWICFWHDIPKLQRRPAQILWSLASLLFAACVTMIFTSNSLIKEPIYFGVEMITRALAVLGWMARLSVSAEGRHFFYPVLDDPYLPVMVALGGAVLAASVFGGITLMRRPSLEKFAAIVFLLLCIPYTQLIPFLTPSLVADRWLSLAMWPVLLLLVALAWRFKPMPRSVIILVFALAWGFQTMERPRDWRSFATLAETDIRAYPWYDIPVMYKIVNVDLPKGMVIDAREMANKITEPQFKSLMTRIIDAEYALHVDAIATGNPQNAMYLLEQAELDPKYSPVQAKWNPAYATFIKYYLTILTKEWKFLAKHFPDDVTVSYNTGLWLMKVHTYNEAKVYLHAAVESQRLPESMRGMAFMNYGLALLESGQTAEAESPLLAALVQSPPNFKAYCSLSKLYKYNGQIDRASRAEAECLKLTPSGGMK